MSIYIVERGTFGRSSNSVHFCFQSWVCVQHEEALKGLEIRFEEVPMKEYR